MMHICLSWLMIHEFCNITYLTCMLRANTGSFGPFLLLVHYLTGITKAKDGRWMAMPKIETSLKESTVNKQ